MVLREKIVEEAKCVEDRWRGWRKMDGGLSVEMKDEVIE